MIKLPDYRIIEKIDEYNGFYLYKGFSEKDRCPVIIKVLERKGSTPLAVSCFISEYELCKDLEIDGIAKPISLFCNGDFFAVIINDKGFISLRNYVKSYHKDINIYIFFDIALNLIKVLSELHSKGITHNNLNTVNVLINPDTLEINIINLYFSDTCIADNENRRAYKPDDNPEYSAPEQLGLGDVPPDHRCDYYSLGVVLYEILTGRLPLQPDENNDWVYTHTVKNPIEPAAINPLIPVTVSDIIMKLLSKTPDCRYQTSYGLLKDLNECKNQINMKGSIEPFDLGEMDPPPHLDFPYYLIGREKEAGILNDTYNRIFLGKSEYVLVKGPAGIGKTALIDKIIKPVATEKGYYAYGKYDQLMQNKPYASFASALGDILKQIMTESSDKLNIWKSELQKALGQSGAVISELIPELGLLIGSQPSCEALHAKESQNRLMMAFVNFIRVLARRNSPLVIFLDDLQWADMASLKLLEYLYNCADLNYFLIIGAYRDNEINDNNILRNVIDNCTADSSRLQIIELIPLDMKNVKKFVAETLHCSLEVSASISRTLFRKTSGNPFYLIQMLESMYDEKIIKFNMVKGCWEWMAEALKSLKTPEDFIDIIKQRLFRLQSETLRALKTASCIGNSFNLKELSLILKKNPGEIAALLKPAVLEGMIYLNTDRVKETQASIDDFESDSYEFLHDKVAQSAYSMLSENEKKEISVNLGHLLIRDLMSGGSYNITMPVLHHLNFGLDLISDPTERLRLAEYNLLYAKKMKLTAAYDLALGCTQAGLKLLPEDPWKSCFNLCAGLYSEYAQCKFLIGEIDDAEAIFDFLQQHMRTVSEITDLLSIKMHLYTNIGDYSKAVCIGINALKKHGMTIPESPNIFHIIKELLLYKLNMLNKKAEDLVELPEIKCSEHKEISKHLINLIIASSTDYPDLFTFLIIKAGNCAVRYGNGEISSAGFLGYSIVEGNIFQNFSKGYKLSSAAIELAEKYNVSGLKCIIYFTFGSLVLHWTQHKREGFVYIRKALDYAFETGNILMAGYAYGVLLEDMFLIGRPLTEIMEEAEKYLNFGKRIKHDNLVINATVYKKLSSSLISCEDLKSSLDHLNLNEDEFLKSVRGDKGSLSAHNYSKLLLWYFNGNYNDALLMTEEMKKSKGYLTGFMLSSEYVFYHSLILAAICRDIPSKQRKGYIRVIKNNQRRMKKWADSCPQNFLHKYLLVKAELASISGNIHEAEKLYDKAIESAHENGYIQNAAIGSELAAGFYLSANRKKIAKTYIDDAYHLFTKWGAKSKANDVKSKYSLITGESAFEDNNRTGFERESLEKINKYINALEKDTPCRPDIHTINNMLKSIAEHSEQDKLFETFLNIAMDCVCADTGYLIFERYDKLYIEAAKDCRKKPDVELICKPLEQNKDPSDMLPKSIVLYVARTLEPVIINNKEQIGIFSHDPYISGSGIKSIVCIPLQFRNIFIGILYLGNSNIYGIFNKDRIELLTLLANQMVYEKLLNDLISNKDSGAIDGKPDDPLTERENEVLRHIASGLSNKEIADSLDMTLNTVKTHIKNIYAKLQVNRRVQAAEKARKMNII